MSIELGVDWLVLETPPVRSFGIKDLEANFRQVFEE